MKLFKKLAISVNSRIDAVADRFENREALSSAYIREYERIVAKAKVRLAQVDHEVLRLEHSCSDLDSKIKLWADRARRIHGTDETKALECVARMTKCEENRKQVLKSLEDTRELKSRMARDVDHIFQKLKAHKRRHQNLASRQVCADAVHVMQDADTGLETDIDDLFMRWETDVVASELHARLPDAHNDLLDHEFDMDEQEQALRITLEEIIANREPDKEK